MATVSDESGLPGPDAPFLPSAPPPPSAPSLPDRPQPIAAPVEVPRFSAKEMREATKPRATEAPAYGGLPEATSQSAGRIEELRRQAAKKRRRNRTAAWIIALVFFLIVVAAGVTSYILFQSEEPTESPVGAPAATTAPT